MLSKDIVEATVAAAHENNIAPAALLAVVEIESAGKPYEADGKTPRFLFERHKFYEELEDLPSHDKLRLAVGRGLAHKPWKRSTQYADQGTSSARLNLLSRAAEIDKECAYRACSWGLGQTMGNLHSKLGFPSAIAMVEAMIDGGIRIQINLMVRFIQSKGLDKHLAKRSWAAFARGYNGARYEENKYDTKLAKAYAKWVAIHPEDGVDEDDLPEADIAEYGERGPLIEGYQKRLAELGYHPGTIDGIYGSHTRAAVLAFQAENGLTKDGRIGPLTRAALNRPTAKPMPVSEDRAKATVEDLAKAGSGTIIDAKAAETASKVVVVTGATKAVQDNFDVLGSLQEWVTGLSGIRAVLDPAIAIAKYVLSAWWIFAIVAGIVILQKTDAIKKARLAAHRLGQHLGR